MSTTPTSSSRSSGGHNLQAELIELAAEIAKVEGITIPDSVLMALTS